MRSIKIIERIISSIPLILGVILVVFIFMRLTPGDPVDIMMGHTGNVSKDEVAALRDQYHLDEPLLVQVKDYFLQVLQGDFGESYTKSEPVLTLIGETLPATIELALTSCLFALLIGIPLGAFSAVKHNSLLDRAGMATSFVGISVPSFWLGIMLIMVFSVNLGILPVKGRLDVGVHIKSMTNLYLLDSLLTLNWAGFSNAFLHLLLPSVTLGSSMAAIVARVTRSSMLEVMNKDYIVLARSKGLKEYRVITAHALRNALMDTVTVVGLEIGSLLGGNMIVETVFGWPGLGRMAVNAIMNRDYPLVQGVVMFYAFTFIAANLVVDILYTYLNPKLRA